MREGVLLVGVERDVFAPNVSDGSVRVWARAATGVWTEEAVLRPSDIAPNSNLGFAWSVAYDGERAAVGGTETDPVGAAYVYGPASLPVATEPGVSPAATVLSAPRPNPFRDRATFTLRLERPQPVEAALYDLLGRRVRFVHSGPLPAGEHRLAVEGVYLTPGLYVLRVTGEDFARSQRLIHVR
jgi:hypothetical protein